MLEFVTSKMSRFNGRSSRSQPTITNENACTSIVGIVVPERESVSTLGFGFCSP